MFFRKRNLFYHKMTVDSWELLLYIFATAKETLKAKPTFILAVLIRCLFY